MTDLSYFQSSTDRCNFDLGLGMCSPSFSSPIGSHHHRSPSPRRSRSGTSHQSCCPRTRWKCNHCRCSSRCCCCSTNRWGSRKCCSCPRCCCWGSWVVNLTKQIVTISTDICVYREFKQISYFMMCFVFIALLFILKIL